ncbi:hypothetical protein NM688_g7713 [Phlebia brevispora]|uniref:Uncharacterized protein n=1 Tax=Phlebia brevispora TaxID=194682 RepID=A0ACC1S296_9APHY|nr:hypothetical protein NM688_g7713 [Phlebia brevispora]
MRKTRPPSCAAEESRPEFVPDIGHRIWASNEAELDAAMAALSSERRNNVFLNLTAEPMVLLSKGKWPEERWEMDGTDVVHLSFVREYTQEPQQTEEFLLPPSKSEPHAIPDTVQEEDHSPPSSTPISHDDQLCDANMLLSIRNEATLNLLRTHCCSEPDHGETYLSYSLSEPFYPRYNISSLRSTVDESEPHQVNPLYSHPYISGTLNSSLNYSYDISQSTIPLYRTPGYGGPSTSELPHPPYNKPPQSPYSSSPSTSSSKSVDEDYGKGRDTTPPTSPSCVSPSHAEIPCRSPSCPIPLMAPNFQSKCEVSESQTVHDAPAAPTTDDSFAHVQIPSELPPEIDYLLQCQTLGVPIKLVASRDSPLLPVSLPEQYGVVFLDLFEAISAEHRIMAHDPAKGTTRLAWDFVFVRLRGEERQAAPWWRGAGPSPDVESKEDLHRLLPSELHQGTDVEYDAEPSFSDMSCPRSWYCASCGMLNVQRFFCFQPCASCGAGNGRGALDAGVVREPHRVTLHSDEDLWSPGSMNRSVVRLVPGDGAEQDQAFNILTYSPMSTDSVKVAHISTCNWATLQKVPDELFKDFQMQVPLAPQETKNRQRSTRYYTYLSGEKDTMNAAVPWSLVPSCVTRAKEYMEAHCRQAFQDNGFAVGFLTTLAWYSKGSEKSRYTDARTDKVIMMCLGADVDLAVTPCSTLHAVEGDTQHLSSALPGPSLPAEVLNGLHTLDTMDTDSEEDVPLSVAHPRVVSATSASTAPVSGAKPKKGSEVFITLVHGDMLILSGDEFQWSLKRTGMSLHRDENGAARPGRAARLGRKSGGKKGQEEPQGPDLLEPHILRSLSNVKATAAYASHSGCHFVVLDIDGVAWLFGRGERSALGVPDEVVSENAPIRLSPQDLGAPEGTKFVHAACGRNHTLLVGSGGQLWTCGANHMGQCAHNVCQEVERFKSVNYFKNLEVPEKVVKVAAGVTFSLALTESGKVYAFGSAEKGQLGNGKTGEHIVTSGKVIFDAETEPLLVRGMDDKKITQIACGQQHSVALSEDGMVYVWGCNGYGRMGLGTGLQHDVLFPKTIPQFAGPNKPTMAQDITAGPTSTVVIDRQRMFWLAGKWKNTGDGSAGQPYSSFRFMPDIQACKIASAACGGVTHFLLTPDEDGGVMTICFGQGASNGELGLGPDEPKSATKPTKNSPLAGIDVFQCVKQATPGAGLII